jgi:hypothetical protein
VICHRVKALGLTPERLDGRVNIRGQLAYLANQPLERSRRRSSKDPNEPPRRTWGAAAQKSQARPDDADVREHGTNSG